MEDVELVLRFFALRHAKHFRGGMQPFLTKYSIRALNFTDEDIAILRDLFASTFELAEGIFGPLTFRPYNIKKDTWDKSPQKAFCDAVMVGLSSRLDRRDEFLSRRNKIVEKTRQLFFDNPPGSFTGRGNSKADIEKRAHPTFLKRCLTGSWPRRLAMFVELLDREPSRQLNQSAPCLERTTK